MLLQRLPQHPSKNRLKLVHKYLARGQAKVADLGHRRIGILADADNQAKAQRLLAFVGGYDWRALSRMEVIYPQSI